jgi:glutathione S-transferase
MADDRKLIFFHSPNTRSAGARILLEELGVPYDMHVLNMKAGEQRGADYLKVNPMGKVPAVLHGDTLVTEQVALYIYLPDAFPKAGLSPALTDPLRGSYLRWIAYYGSCFEPAVVDHALKRPPAPPSMCPYGDYDTMLNTLVAQLGKGPYMLGDRFSATDLLWGLSLAWMTSFKIVPELPVIMDYVARIKARPSYAKVTEADAKLSAEHEAAAKKVS